MNVYEENREEVRKSLVLQKFSGSRSQNLFPSATYKSSHLVSCHPSINLNDAISSKRHITSHIDMNIH